MFRKKLMLGTLGVVLACMMGCASPFAAENETATEKTETTDTPVLEEVTEVVEMEETEEKDKSAASDAEEPAETEEEKDNEVVPEETEENDVDEVETISVQPEELLGTFLMVSAEINDGVVTTHYDMNGGVTASLVFYEDNTADFCYLSYDEEITAYHTPFELQESDKGMEGSLQSDMDAETWSFTFDGEMLIFTKETRINKNNSVVNTMQFLKATTDEEE